MRRPGSYGESRRLATRPPAPAPRGGRAPRRRRPEGRRRGPAAGRRSPSASSSCAPLVVRQLEQRAARPGRGGRRPSTSPAPARAAADGRVAARASAAAARRSSAGPASSNATTSPSSTTAAAAERRAEAAQLRVGGADLPVVAGQHADPPAVDVDDRPDAVPLHLVRPAAVLGGAAAARRRSPASAGPGPGIGCRPGRPAGPSGGSSSSCRRSGTARSDPCARWPCSTTMTSRSPHFSDLVGAAVPDRHRPAAVLARRDLARERGVLQRMVLGVHGQVVALRVVREPLAASPTTPARRRARAGSPSAAGGVVLLDDERVVVALRQRSLGRAPARACAAVPLAAVRRQLVRHAITLPTDLFLNASEMSLRRVTVLLALGAPPAILFPRRIFVSLSVRARRAPVAILSVLAVLAAGLVAAAPAQAAASDLFFSEYIEGSGFNKAIEIFNGTGADVPLSGYRLDSTAMVRRQ